MFLQSPNYTKGRGGKPIAFIVIHWFGMGTIDSAESSFMNPARQASSHYLISDDRLDQMVKEEDTAWHCGVFDMNQRSIGIEHDANPLKLLSEKSYQTSGKLVREICDRYGIPLDRDHIKKHSEIKPTQCPGTIDLDKIINIAKGATMSTSTVEAQLTAMTKLKDAYVNKYDHKVKELADLQLQITNIQDTCKANEVVTIGKYESQIAELQKRPISCPTISPSGIEDMTLTEIAGSFFRKLIGIK